MGCIQSFRQMCDSPKNTNVRISLPAVCVVWQTSMIILFGVFIRYDEESSPHWIKYRKLHNVSSDIENDFYFRYPSKCFYLFYFCQIMSHSSILDYFTFYKLNMRLCAFGFCLLLHQFYYYYSTN